jgi:phosphoribosylamine-glycine ligase
MYRLEEDRGFAKQISEKYLGMSKVDYKVFKDKKKAIKYIEGLDYEVVIKAFDDSDLSASTYIPKSKSDTINFLKYDYREMFTVGKGVIIEKFHKNSYEICLGLYSNGKEFLPYVLLNQEYKGALPGNMGNILTGEVGTVMKWYSVSDLPQKMQDIYNKLSKYYLFISFLYVTFV